MGNALAIACGAVSASDFSSGRTNGYVATAAFVALGAILVAKGIGQLAAAVSEAERPLHDDAIMSKFGPKRAPYSRAMQRPPPNAVG